jgi:hypothetical protein
MAWTPVTTISPISNWLFTEPVEGSFFRLKHSSFPRDSFYEIAQAEVGADGTIQLFDARAVKPSLELQTIEFKKPGIFSSRRIALRRVPKQPTFESELRRVIRDQVLRDPEENLFPPRRVSWQIGIEVSDYVAQLASENASQDNSIDLTYVSNGDTSGVFYYLGTAKLSRAFANPATDGTIAISSNGVLGPAYAVSNLAGRDEAIGHTNPASNAYFKFDLGALRKLIVSHYSIQGRGDSNGQFPRNWKLQGSNDGNSWTDINVQSSNSSIGLNTWFSQAISGQTVAYRYLMILQTGVNSSGETYLVAKEVEFYGKLTIN